MMGRAAALLLVMTATGCSDGDAPPILVTDFGAPPDGAVDLAGAGGPCTTACDCPAGLACKQQQCEPAAVPVYCCGAASCADTSLCEFPNGTIGQCDRADAGGTPPDVDAGATPTACTMTQCSRGTGGDAFCKLACGAATSTCVRTGGIDHCIP